jgi:hypothetical protein
VTAGPDPDALRDLMAERLTGYVELWEQAAAKLGSGDYHADDLVDDWFRWMGMVARDTTATAVMAFGGMAAPGTAAGEGPEGRAG